MRPDDFFIERQQAHDPWGPPPRLNRSLNTQLLTALRASPVQDHDDLDAAVGLARLVHDELEKYGTDSSQELTEHGIREAVLTLHAVLKRVGVAFNLPFRDYATFRSQWLREGCSGSWQKRRDMLNDLFNPLHDQLIEKESRALSSTPLSPSAPTQ
ncbi:hypothetical protein [Actinomadura sp. 9N215]|uniref:hypothetical protein n=1 Tax=Actinomadura sp. 9N215 TaxID=3375150 RepID=UPI0037A1E3BC